MATALATTCKRAELAEFVSGVQSENSADEKGNQGNNGEGFDSNGHGLMDGAAEVKFLAAKGLDENRPDGAAGQTRQAANICQSIDRG